MSHFRLSKADRGSDEVQRRRMRLPCSDKYNGLPSLIRPELMLNVLEVEGQYLRGEPIDQTGLAAVASLGILALLIASVQPLVFALKQPVQLVQIVAHRTEIATAGRRNGRLEPAVEFGGKAQGNESQLSKV